ncbi:MAG: hypothetical protein RL094_405 [Candidatus Parcubacteria bacterium]|jgi:hypothetical protein
MKTIYSILLSLALCFTASNVQAGGNEDLPGFEQVKQTTTSERIKAFVLTAKDAQGIDAELNDINEWLAGLPETNREVISRSSVARADGSVLVIFNYKVTFKQNVKGENKPASDEIKEAATPKGVKTFVVRLMDEKKKSADFRSIQEWLMSLSEDQRKDMRINREPQADGTMLLTYSQNTTSNQNTQAKK